MKFSVKLPYFVLMEAGDFRGPELTVIVGHTSAYVLRKEAACSYKSFDDSTASGRD